MHQLFDSRIPIIVVCKVNLSDSQSGLDVKLLIDLNCFPRDISITLRWARLVGTFPEVKSRGTTYPFFSSLCKRIVTKLHMLLTSLYSFLLRKYYLNLKWNFFDMVLKMLCRLIMIPEWSILGNLWKFFGPVMIVGKYLGKVLMWVINTGKNVWKL